MRIHTKWLVVNTATNLFSDGCSERQALFKHRNRKGSSKDYHVLLATSQMPFAPKGRKPRETEASVTQKGEELVGVNCTIRTMYKMINGERRS